MHEYVREVFSAAGDIVIKSMMGGYLVYLNVKREISKSPQTAPNSGVAGAVFFAICGYYFFATG